MLVSIVIPCYNAELFIIDTIRSILEQTYKNIEIIIIDDGSTDDSAKIIKQIKSDNLQYFYQENRGVCYTRNKGLSLAKGDFVVFFDSDDIMSKNFVSSRVEYLDSNEEISYCCADLITFPVEKKLKGAIIDLPEEIFITRIGFATCPSNYMFRLKALNESGVKFNTKLFNSADRLFLLEVNQKLNGGYVREGGVLYYRVHTNSMSQNLNGKILQDNIRYLNLLKTKNLIPKEYDKLALSKLYFIIGALGFNISSYNTALRYFVQSFLAHPIYFIKQRLKLKTI